MHLTKKQTIEILSNYSKEKWNLNDLLELVLNSFYIDGLFVKVKRDKVYREECFYIILGVKEDCSREILAIVNQPTESATAWE
ncbi:MAG: transposase, partial [Bacteroidales bacterium]